MNDQHKTTPKKIAKDILESTLPIYFPHDLYKKASQRVFLTFSLPRSGQHLIISWICLSLGQAIHFNHCRLYRNKLRYELLPVTGRRVVYQNHKLIDDNGISVREKLNESLFEGNHWSNILYSIETLDVQSKLHTRVLNRLLPEKIIIIRDPLNWLASIMKHSTEGSDTVRISQMIDSYKYILTNKDIASRFKIISFNHFLFSKSYRSEIAKTTNIPFQEDIEESYLSQVPKFGGGSSFSGTQVSHADLKDDVFGRYRNFMGNNLFKELAVESGLLDLSKLYFSDLPYFGDMLSEFNGKA